MKKRRTARLGAFTTAAVFALGGAALTALPANAAAAPQMMTVSLMTVDAQDQFPARGFWLVGIQNTGNAIWVSSAPAIPVSSDPASSTYAADPTTKLTVPAPGQTGPLVYDGNCVEYIGGRYSEAESATIYRNNQLLSVKTSDAVNDQRCLKFTTQSRADGAISFKVTDTRFQTVQLNVRAGATTSSSGLLSLDAGNAIWAMPVNAAPDAPGVDTINVDNANKSATITGTGEPGATITVTGAPGGPVTVTAGADGRWQITVPGLVTGDNDLQVTQTVNGETSDPTKITATVEPPVESSPAPGVPRVSGVQVDPENKTAHLEGTGEPGATVTVTGVQGGPATVTVGADGTWQITVGLPSGDSELHITQTVGGKTSDEVVIPVTIDELETPMVHPLIAGGFGLLALAGAGTALILRRRNQTATD